MTCALGVALALIGVTGCSSTESGSAVKAGTTPAASVAPGQLNTGSYPTTPSAPLGNSADEQAGRQVEGRRMAGFVVGPWQVDPSLTRADTNGATLMTDYKHLVAVRYPSTMYRVTSESMIVGFASERWIADPKVPTKLRNAVLRFPDDVTAATVAQGWTDGALNMLVRPDDSQDPVPAEPITTIPIPGHPEVTGVLFTFRDGDQTVREVSVASGHGPYVLVQTARAADTPEHAADLIGRTLDLQIPLIDRFQPTDAALIRTLPLDPTGLVARTLPAKTDPSAVRDGTYDAAGALQLEQDPVGTGELFADAGVDVVSIRLATVFQARDSAGATRLATGLVAAAEKQPSSQPAAAVPALPDSRCVLMDDTGGLIPRYHCFATVDRYVFTVESRQSDTAGQQAAAQYRILSAG